MNTKYEENPIYHEDATAVSLVETGGVVLELAELDAALFLLRPHLTFTRSPSKSRPAAHACAASSADARSVKFTNAHRDFATCTTDFILEGSREGRDVATRVRIVSSVADVGREERKSDVFSNRKLVSLIPEKR